MKHLLTTLLFLAVTCSFAQDVIVKKDGSTILSKVMEITPSEIKYKSYKNPDGPLYTMLISDVMVINYANGERESFESSSNLIDNKAKEEKKYVLKAGTEIPIQIISPVKAADVSVGQVIHFRVNRDINVDGKTMLPYGTPVKGTVYKAEKSSWWGTKGKLGIRIENITLPNGGIIPLQNGNVYVTGTNRTALAVVLFLVVTIPACAICGSKAEIPVGYEIIANVAKDVSFNNDGEIIEIAGMDVDTFISSERTTISSVDIIYTIDDKERLHGLTLNDAKKLVEKEALEKNDCDSILDATYDYSRFGKRISNITIKGKGQVKNK